MRELLLGGDTSNQICLAYSLIMSNRWIAAQGHRLNPEEGELTAANFLKRNRAVSPAARKQDPSSPLSSIPGSCPKSPGLGSEPSSPLPHGSPIRRMGGSSGSESEGSALIYGAVDSISTNAGIGRRAFNLMSKGKQSVRWHLGTKHDPTGSSFTREVPDGGATALPATCVHGAAINVSSRVRFLPHLC